MSGYYPPPNGAPQQYGQPQHPSPGGQGWGQQQFGGPPGQYQQPPQQQWMPPPGPPPQGYQQPGPPPHGYQQPGAPLQGYQQPGPPPQGYQQPGPSMQQHFQQPPPVQGYQQPPPQGMPPAGQQPQPQYNQPMSQQSLPSPGYGNDVAQGNAMPNVEALMKAMGGFKKDHNTVIRILASTGPREMALLRQTFAQRNKGETLESKIDNSSSFRSHYGDVLLQLVRGPLLSDVWNVNRAVKGLGTKEDMLDDVLIGRSNADMRAIKSAYQATFQKSMESDVEGDLSAKTKTMFQLIMRASRTEESYPFNPVEVARDAETLEHAMHPLDVNQEMAFTVLTQRSDNQIRAIVSEFQKKYKRSLEDTIRTNFTGHMQDALLLCVGRAVDRAKTDAYGLEDTMKGLGTKDNLLVNKTVRIHWDRENKDQAKKAYQHYFKKDLIGRVKGETSGDYRDALVACLS